MNYTRLGGCRFLLILEYHQHKQHLDRPSLLIECHQQHHNQITLQQPKHLTCRQSLARVFSEGIKYQLEAEKALLNLLHLTNPFKTTMHKQEEQAKKQLKIWSHNLNWMSLELEQITITIV